MRSLLLGTFAFITVATAMTFETDDANAAVCGRGPYRAGCVVGPGGAAVVGRRYVPASGMARDDASGADNGTTMAWVRAGLWRPWAMFGFAGDPQGE
jgi:hypothetical protein